MASATATKISADATGRSHLPWIVGIAIVARVLTAGFYFHSTEIIPLHNWGYENVSIAFSLYAGHGYASPFFFPSGPTAFMPPGYPLLIAAFMRVLGTDTAATVGIIAFQILLSVVTVVLVQRVARRYFGERTGNFAGLLCALVEPLLIAPLYIWDTCLSALILIAAVAIAPRVRTKRDFALAGLACAAAALINPALLPTLLAIAAWSAWRARIVPWLGMLCFLVAFAPWPIRNYETMRAFIPLRSNFGYELWQGNHPGSDGETPAFKTPAVNAEERSLFLTEGELGYMHQKDSLATSWIQSNPREFARLTVRRFIHFWSGSAKSPGPMTLALVVLGIGGVALLWRARQMFLLFALPLLLYPLPYYITHADARYQFVLDPLLAILAGSACESFFAWCARRPAPLPTLASSTR